MRPQRSSDQPAAGPPAGGPLQGPLQPEGPSMRKQLETTYFPAPPLRLWSPQFAIRCEQDRGRGDRSTHSCRAGAAAMSRAVEPIGGYRNDNPAEVVNEAAAQHDPAGN